MMDSLHQHVIKGGERPGSESSIVYCSNLVNEKIGIPCELFTCLDPDAKRFRVVDEICRERDDDRGWMPCVEKSLVLKYENGAGLTGLRPFLRVEICQPDCSALSSLGHVPPR